MTEKKKSLFVCGIMLAVSIAFAYWSINLEVVQILFDEPILSPIAILFVFVISYLPVMGMILFYMILTTDMRSNTRT
jgi:hypothetical protein